MIFHRLRVANYRGIRNAEVRFSPTGVTVVQGPNEIGKSSLLQAVGTLFDLRATARSNNREIRKIKPIDRDAAPEIELEAETGAYHFVYRKRYLKETLTELKIIKPRPDTKTGDDAHHAVQDILKATIDRVLWDALRIQQGNAVGLPWVKADDGNNPLIAALDMAVSGGSRNDAGSESLHQKARQEYDKYFTPEKGAPGRILVDSEAGVSEMERTVAEYAERLRTLEDLLESAAAMRTRLSELNRDTDNLAGEVKACAEAVDEVARLERLRDGSREANNLATNILAAAERERDARIALVQAETDAAADLEKAARELDDAAAPMNAASRLVEETRAAAGEADIRRREAESLASISMADYEYHRNLQDLDQLLNRKLRVDEARARAAGALQQIAANAMTEEEAKKIAMAESDVDHAAAQLQGSATSLRLEALADATVMVDGSENRLPGGSGKEIMVAERLRLEIPGLLTIGITPGAGAGELAHKLHEAENRLRALLSTHGLQHASQAAALMEKRREAERALADLDRSEREYLRDLSHDDLIQRIGELQGLADSHRENRSSFPPLPGSLGKAKAAQADAESARAESYDLWSQAEAARAEAGRRQEAAKERYVVCDERVKAARRDLDRARAALAQARSAQPDEELMAAVEKAAAARSNALAVLAGIEDQLCQLDPEAVRERYDSFAHSVDNLKNQRSRLQVELAELRIKLEYLGGENLYEKLSDAEAELERRRRADVSLHRRADAARLLWITLDKNRNETRRAYALPLRHEIERLGRDVFGSDFAVDIDDNLQIANRTLNGYPVPYGELSGGAQEQLSLIHRAACSILASRHKGMPLILDDALGYSDTARLRGMGLALSRAARQCQIIILTCMPDRYAYVAAAQIVNLGKTAE